MAVRTVNGWFRRVLPRVAVATIAFWLFARRARAGAPVIEFARLLPPPPGMAGLGGTRGMGSGGGLLLGLDAAWAKTLPAPGDAPEGSGALGVRAGWSFPNGLTVQARYDDLGVTPDHSNEPLQLATLGFRYSVPFLIPQPFVELDAGPAFVLGGVQLGAGGALGVSLPLGPLGIDLFGKDWLVPIAGVLRQTISVGVGFSILFSTAREP